MLPDFKLGVMLFTLLFSGLTICSADIASENFESYAASSLLNNLSGGTGWAGNWATETTPNGTYTVVSQGLNYTNGEVGINGGSQSAQFTLNDATTEVVAWRQFAPQTNTIYLSFLFRPTVDDTSASDNDFFQVGFGNTGNQNPTASILDNGGAYLGRLGTGGDTAENPDSGVASTLNTTVFMVMRLEDTGGDAGTYDTLTLYVNPDSLTEGNNAFVTATANNSLDISTAAFLNLRRARQEDGDSYLIDEIRIGTTFESVVTPIPEPSTFLLLSMAGAGGWWMRRKKN